MIWASKKYEKREKIECKLVVINTRCKKYGKSRFWKDLWGALGRNLGAFRALWVVFRCSLCTLAFGMELRSALGWSKGRIGVDLGSILGFLGVILGLILEVDGRRREEKRSVLFDW